ncbi:MAG: hypothetical protein K0R26_876 [Bacteroidota bacterium]|nr:hypothetical protein [Bacteroidota bacterium]
MPVSDYQMLQTIKIELQNIPENDPGMLKDYVQKVIKAFNYQDQKVHGHLNELMLTIETGSESNPENFKDIYRKLVYLVDLILKAF